MARVSAMVALVALSLFPAAATAERSGEEARCRPGEDCTVIDYGEADQVLGEIIQPDGTVVPGHRRGRSEGLVRARTHFIPELVKSVEDI